MKMIKPLLFITILSGLSAASRAAFQNSSDEVSQDPAASTGPEPAVSPSPASTVRALIEWDDLEPGKGPVYGQDWSPDGRLIATADYDVVRLWDQQLRREVGVLLGHSDFIWDVAWSPDGAGILASCSQDGSLRLWDGQAFSQLAVIDCGAANCLAWAPSGQHLAVGAQSGRVQIWQVAEMRRLHLWNNAENSPILCLDWSPRGRLIAIGDQQGAIYLFDASRGELQRTLVDRAPGSEPVNGLAWAPDGQLIASAHPDGRVHWWEVPSGRLLRISQAHEGWARGLAWSPDGQLLASTGQDKHIRLWQTQTGQLYAQEKHNFLPVWSVSWSPEGEKVASGAGAFDQPHTGATVVWIVP